MFFCAYSLYGYTGARFATITRSPPPAFALRASEPPNCPIWMLFERSAALVCAPPLIDWRSTSRPLSLKMPFSNAYHGIQSSALILLYAATTLVQHARAVGEAEPAAACVGELEAPPGPAPPPQAVATIARSTTRAASVFVMSPPFRFALFS